MTHTEKRMQALFEELVPPTGAAGNAAGELVRAACHLYHRFVNDGDKVGIGPGNETCNSPARFLEQYGNRDIIDAVQSCWNLPDDNIYRMAVTVTAEAVADYVEGNLAELREKAAPCMFDFREPQDDEW